MPPTVTASPDRPGILCRPEWLAAILMTATIAGFHFYFWLHAGGFWRDEVNLIHLAQRPTLLDMSRDSFPVLMPLIVRGWQNIGLAGTDLSLRALGLLIGLGIIAALWLAAWRARRSPPLIGLALFGFNSLLIVFGDSLRAYGLGCFLIMLTAVAAMAQVVQPSWRRTFWLALLATASVQTLYHNAVLVGAICAGAMVAGWGQRNGRAVLQAFFAGLVAALSLGPYVSGLLAGRDTSAVIRSGLKSWRFLAAFQDALGFPLSGYIYVWGFLLLVLLVLAVKTGGRLANNASDHPSALRTFAGVTALAAVVGYVEFLRLAAFPSQAWYLLPLLALVAICCETGLPEWTGKWRWPLLGLVLGTALIALPATERDLQNRFTNVNLWAAQLNQSAGPGDYVVVTPWFCGITFGYYFHGPADWNTVPPLADHATHRYDLVQAAIQNTNVMQPVFAGVTNALQTGHRVWVLASLGLMNIPVPGTAAPASLPAAPLPRSGWSEGPYTMVWNAQLAQLLSDHAKQFQRVKNPTAGQSIIEGTELFMAEGWREDAAPVPFKTTSGF